MKILEGLVQGSEEWKAIRKGFFTASEAPMMMGDHKNISRNQLLDAKKGWTTIVDDYLQKLFDKGHAAEESARPLAEIDVGDELFPVVGTLEIDGLNLLSSFDGLTMLEDVCFEHKLFNKTLAENVLNNVLEPHYYWQLEQQLLVSGADKAYFVTSDGTKNNWQAMYYESIPERREALIKGWKQFAIDLENHEPQAKAEKVVTSGLVRELPAINYKMNGLALESNLDLYKHAATDLVELSKKPLESDQDFADAEARQKVFTKAEKDIKDACDRVMGEIDSIDTFVKDMRFISEQIRQARLAEGKQIKARKEELRHEIIDKANQQASGALNEAIAKANAKLPNIDFDPASAMKGKRTIESLQDAADTEVAKAKIQINEFVELAQANMLVIADNREFDFLFNDWAQIAFKANDDFNALVAARISEHKEREQKRLEAERKRIEQEAKEKAEREVAAKAKAEQQRIQEEEEAKAQREAQAKLEAQRLAEQQRITEESGRLTKEAAEKEALAAKQASAPEVEPVRQSVSQQPASTGYMQQPKASHTEQQVKGSLSDLRERFGNKVTGIRDGNGSAAVELHGCFNSAELLSLSRLLSEAGQAGDAAA